MKNKEQDSMSQKELQFELKYCERCGGLWLRPVGGGQIYCMACGRAIAELPTRLKEVQTSGVSGVERWGGDDGEFEEYGGYEGSDLDATGGAA